MNLLFSVLLDVSKTVPDAASKFIKEFEEKNAADEAASTKDDDTQKVTQIDKGKQQIKKNNVTYSLIPANRFSGAGATEAFYGLYAEVKGDNIEKITYTLDKDVFYKKTEATDEEAADYDETKYVGNMTKEMIDGKIGNDEVMGDQSKREWLLTKAGNSYTVAYDKQNTVGNFYAIGVTAKQESEELSREAVYGNLADTLKENVVHVTVTFKDGHAETQDIVFTRNDTTILSKIITPQWK